jgi:hypothetical protein
MFKVKKMSRYNDFLSQYDKKELSPCYFGTYSERQKYGINSLKIKQNFFQKNLWTGQF